MGLDHMRGSTDLSKCLYSRCTDCLSSFESAYVGACGTCPSSTSTMKMGIERVLMEKFGDLLKEVVQVDKQDIGASIPVS